MGVYDNTDAINTSEATFSCRSWSELLTNVKATSDKSYIGQITDPETQATLKAEFAAQFHAFEEGALAPADKIVKDANGNLVCDSIHLRIFFQSYYGNSTAPFKMEVSELSMLPERMLQEDSSYYADIDLTRFTATAAELQQRHPSIAWPVRKMFTPTDYTESDATLSSSTHYKNVHIALPKQYGERMLRMYRDSADYFTSSYKFIRHVCPGFYFRIADGNGVLLYVDVASIDLYYRYQQSDTETVQGMCRFSATNEVIQATSFKGGGNEALVRDSLQCTYIKSPAGIGTAMRLPVDEIFRGHERDSITLASLNLMRYNANAADRSTALSPCKSIAMVEKSESSKFFDKGYVRNPRAYAVASLTDVYNLYSFRNIGRLVAYLRNKKMQGALQ